MHIISMQGKIVWEILQRDGIYHADASKVREHGDYTEDTIALGGYTPIWGYAYPDMSTLHMGNGKTLERLRRAMSLPQENCFDDFYLLELDIPDSLVLTGKWHNDERFCKVFPYISMSQVRAVYSVRDSENSGYYFKVLTPIYLTDKDVITRDELDCYKWLYMEKVSTDYFDKGDVGNCLYCGRVTEYMYKRKHYCTLRCMFRHKEQLIQFYDDYADDPWKLMHMYEGMTDCEFVK